MKIINNFWLAVGSILDIGATSVQLLRTKKKLITLPIENDWENVGKEWSNPK